MPAGSRPAVTVVIPTHDRPALLPDAVGSALGQSLGDVEVVVVDDGSTTPVELPADRRLRLVRLPTSRGNAAARNAGLAAATGRWVTCLDDDDVLLPGHAEVALAAWERSTLPPPVGVVTAVEVLDPAGRVREVRRPPTRPRGGTYSLEPLEPGRSYNAKQSLVVEADVLRSIGGWDEAFRSRTVTELFLRLNRVCSLEGCDEATYRLREHPGPRVSSDPRLRQASFAQLVAKHGDLFEAHPGRYADLLLDHALMSFQVGQHGPGCTAVARAARRRPAAAARRTPQLAGAAARALLRRAR